MNIENSLPLISIIVPTYNHAEFLKEAIDSVINQTYVHWELIIVNNYSDDNTEEVVKSYVDPRIKFINFHNHGVIASSRNKAISESKGDWLAFLDSDDIWYPEKLQDCISALSESEADAICHGEKWRWDNGVSRDVEYGPESKSDYCSLLFKGNCISTSATICRRSAVLDVGCFSEDTDLVTAEDYDLWLKLAKADKKFIFISKILGEYRIHPDGNSQAIRKNISAIISVIDRHIRKFKEHGILDALLYRRAKALVFLGGARAMQKQRTRNDVPELLFQSICQYPFILRTYLQIIIILLPLRIQNIFSK